MSNRKIQQLKSKSNYLTNITSNFNALNSSLINQENQDIQSFINIRLSEKGIKNVESTIQSIREKQSNAYLKYDKNTNIYFNNKRNLIQNRQDNKFQDQNYILKSQANQIMHLYKKQNNKLKIQNQKIKKQNSFLKQNIQLLSKFRIFYEQSQLQIELLQKKCLHYQNDIAHYQLILSKVMKANKLKKMNRSKSDSYMNSQINQSLNKAIMIGQFSFNQKNELKVDNSYSISLKNSLHNNSIPHLKEDLTETFLNIFGRQADSFDLEESMKGIKVEDQIIFGKQFFIKQNYDRIFNNI